MERVNRFERFDATSLKPPVRLDSGFLKVEGRIARVGIQEYHDASGAAHFELRLPEEVFSPESLDSFRQVPVTNQHPPGMLTAANAKQFAVGSVGENVRKDGDYVAAPLMITDADAIKAAEAGRSQLSNGYSCRLEETTPQLIAMFGKHDWVQRDIRGNHVALVDAGRAGPQACLRLDGSDAAASYEFAGLNSNMVVSQEVNQAGQRESAMPHKFRLDGFEVEVADANTQAIIERSLASAVREEKTRADELDKTLTASVKRVEELQVKFDTAMAVHTAEKDLSFKYDGVDVKISDFAADPLKFIGAAVKKDAARLAQLLSVAGAHLGSNEKFDDEASVMTALVKKYAPAVKVDGLSLDSLRASYEVAMAMAPVPLNQAAQIAKPTLVKSDSNDKPEEPNEARMAMIRRQDSYNVKVKK